MKIRHESVRGEPINTIFGEAKIDGHGFVTNFGELGLRVGDKRLLVRPEDFISSCAGFLDAELFPQEGVDLESVPDAVEGMGRPASPETRREYTEEEYWEVIEELCQGGETMNSRGYVEMEILMARLRELNMPLISGSRRMEITDRYKKF